MNVQDAGTIVLATARLAALVAQDEILEPFREKLREWSQDAEYGSFKERVTYLVTCTHCTSVWAAAAVLTLWQSKNGKQAVRLLAASQGAIAALTVIERFEQ